MSDQGTLPEDIAASIEDVQSLLDDNRRLSIAFLSRELQRVEKEMRERFRTLDSSQGKRAAALEAAVEKLSGRLDKAKVVCKALREELDTLKRGSAD